MLDFTWSLYLSFTLTDAQQGGFFIGRDESDLLTAQKEVLACLYNAIGYHSGMWSRFLYL